MNTTTTTKSAMALRATASASASHFHDLDELLLDPADLEAMPFEFGGCDFASAFDDKQLEIDAPSQLHFQTQPRARAATNSRSHKRKSNDSAFSSSFATLSSPSFSSAGSTLPRMATIVQSPAPLVLDHENDDLSSLVPKADDQHENASSVATTTTTIGRWTKKEHELFLEGLRVYGKSWKKISSLVVTRTLVQIRTHAQKYLQKQTKAAMKAAAAAAAAEATASAGSGSGSGSRSASASSKNRPRSDAQPTAWKHHQSQSLFHPIAFPDQHQPQQHPHPHGSSSSSSCLSASSSSSSSSLSLALRKELSAAYQHNTSSTSGMSKLDQLLHDESSSVLPTCAAADNDDSYYASPTGSDDDLAQWLQHRHLPLTFAAASSPAHKRRRSELSGSARPSSHANVWATINPMEAMAATATTSMATATHPSFYTSTPPATVATSHDLHCHTNNPSTLLGNGDFLPPLSSYAATAHCNSSDLINYGSSWM